MTIIRQRHSLTATPAVRNAAGQLVPPDLVDDAPTVPLRELMERETVAEAAKARQSSSAPEQRAPLPADTARVIQTQLATAVQLEVQGKTYGAGKTAAEGFAEYIDAVGESAARNHVLPETQAVLRRHNQAIGASLPQEHQPQLPEHGIDIAERRHYLGSHNNSSWTPSEQEEQ